jgi:hypothetical protein
MTSLFTVGHGNDGIFYLSWYLPPVGPHRGGFVLQFLSVGLSVEAFCCQSAPPWRPRNVLFLSGEVLYRIFYQSANALYCFLYQSDRPSRLSTMSRPVRRGLYSISYPVGLDSCCFQSLHESVYRRDYEVLDRKAAASVLAVGLIVPTISGQRSIAPGFLLEGSFSVWSEPHLRISWATHN